MEVLHAINERKAGVARQQAIYIRRKAYLANYGTSSGHNICDKSIGFPRFVIEIAS